MAILHKRFELPTDEKRTAHELTMPGRALYVLSQPSGLGLQIRIDSVSSDPIDFSQFGAFTVEPGEPGFSRLYLTHNAVPAGVLVLGIASGVRLDASAGGGDVSIGTVAQGAAGPNPWGVSEAELRLRVGALTDGEAAAGNGSLIALLKRLRTLLGGLGASTDAAASGAGANGTAVAVLKRVRDLWELFGFRAANPAPVDQTLTGGADLVDVGTLLGRVGYRGYVAAHQDNAGEVVVESSFDGAAWAQIGVLPAGAGLSLEGIAVDSLRLTGTAGDRVIGEVH